ncbi:MAG: leucine-rich repeat domain-containing protein [Muribaculaceae bacterium]|nr:leucine-rich repeat domain-containing protein [Muribaculaceae bacterium]
MKKFLLVMLLGFHISMANSQNTVRNSDLNGCVWYPLSPVEYGVSELVSFDSTLYATQYRYEMLQKYGQSTFPYYVSDEVPTGFDSTKIGNNNVGKYIVFYNNKLDEFDYYSVVKYVDDSLRLFHKVKPDRVGGLDFELVYVRVNPACINVGDGYLYIFNKDLTLTLIGMSEQIQKSIIIPDSLQLYAKRVQVSSIADSAFVDCISLTSVTIPGSVQKPGMYVFRGCKNLTSATLQEGIPYIDTGMFTDCEKLTSVSIPESVTHIWSVAFDRCKSLASLALPSKLAKIEGTVFRGCTSLKTITCLATTPPQMRADGTTFDGFDRSQCTLIVPKGCKTKYSAADGWKEFKEIREQ